jgi:ATP-binding cassette subfamily F protein 3
MLQIKGLGKAFRGEWLFKSLDFQINERDRIGLVGDNGTGKSTLMKMIAGLMPADEGEIIGARDLTFGYLPQDGLVVRGRSLMEEALSVFESLMELERDMRRLEHELSDMRRSDPVYESKLAQYSLLSQQFRLQEGYSVEAKAGTVLLGLGFTPQDLSRPCEDFSGGWQMRIALAKLLLLRPSLLLLDEPTNHLDLEARNWLETYLNGYPHAFVLISHDRYFLDVTVSRIVEIWNKRVHFYPGNYEQYLKLKNERRTQLESAYRNQQERIQQLEAFINRFRYQATKAKQVQSRIKELDKMERIEIPPEEQAIHFKFPQPKPSGRVVAEFRSVGKRYGPKEVFRGASFLIERGDRVALVGPNGAGKSTLIKLLAGIEPLSSGAYEIGHNVTPDYFAQDQYKELDPEARLLDDLSSVARATTQTELRTLLGCFLFSEDDAFKRIGVLSGGERNRYALARMLLNPANFLLLDEPTNHLDLRAKDVLLAALQEFSGTVVFVSHDRYFIDRLATRIFEVGGGEVRVYPGNYEDYLWRKQGGASAPEQADAAAAAPPDAQPTEEEAAEQKTRRLNPIRLRQLQDRCDSIEEEVARLEAEIAGYEAELAQFRSAGETKRLMDLVASRRKELDALMAEWENVSQAIEAAG